VLAHLHVSDLNARSCKLGSLTSFEDRQKYVTSVPPLPTKMAVKMAKPLLLSGKLNES
jgi:hypothetical protein